MEIIVKKREIQIIYFKDIKVGELFRCEDQGLIDVLIKIKPHPEFRCTVRCTVHANAVSIDTGTGFDIQENRPVVRVKYKLEVWE